MADLIVAWSRASDTFIESGIRGTYSRKNVEKGAEIRHHQPGVKMKRRCRRRWHPLNSRDLAERGGCVEPGSGRGRGRDRLLLKRILPPFERKRWRRRVRQPPPKQADLALQRCHERPARRKIDPVRAAGGRLIATMFRGSLKAALHDADHPIHGSEAISRKSICNLHAREWASFVPMMSRCSRAQ